MAHIPPLPRAGRPSVPIPDGGSVSPPPAVRRKTPPQPAERLAALQKSYGKGRAEAAQLALLRPLARSAVRGATIAFGSASVAGGLALTPHASLTMLHLRFATEMYDLPEKARLLSLLTKETAAVVVACWAVPAGVCRLNALGQRWALHVTRAAAQREAVLAMRLAQQQRRMAVYETEVAAKQEAGRGPPPAAP